MRLTSIHNVNYIFINTCSNDDVILNSTGSVSKNNNTMIPAAYKTNVLTNKW